MAAAGIAAERLLYPPAQIRATQDAVAAELARSSPLLLGHLLPADSPDLGSLIEDLEELVLVYADLEPHLPAALHHTTIHGIQDRHDLLVQLEAQGGVPSQRERPARVVGINGRTRYELSFERVNALILARTTNADIAELLGVSVRTVKRYRREHGLRRPRTELSDLEATVIVRRMVSDEALEGNGELLIQESLHARGVFLPRAQLRAALQQVDRVGRTNSWLEAVRRRKYRVAFPNSLWHMNGVRSTFSSPLARHAFLLTSLLQVTTSSSAGDSSSTAASTARVASSRSCAPQRTTRRRRSAPRSSRPWIASGGRVGCAATTAARTWPSRGSWRRCAGPTAVRPRARDDPRHPSLSDARHSSCSLIHPGPLDSQPVHRASLARRVSYEARQL